MRNEFNGCAILNDSSMFTAHDRKLHNQLSFMTKRECMIMYERERENKSQILTWKKEFHKMHLFF